MHPDLVLIVNLWDLDQQVDEAKDRAAALKAEVTNTQERIGAMTAQMEQLGEQVVGILEKEAGVQAELDKYIMRTQRTRALLDGHKAVDFMTVEKQLAQCQERVSALEDELLELMTARETLQEESNECEVRRGQLSTKKDQAHERWVAEGQEIRAHLEQVWPNRQAAAELLNRELAKRYTGFRQRTLVPVTTVQNKFCRACNVSVQDQMRLEVQAGRRIHTCRGCGRWLLPREEEDDTEVAESEVDE